jgi:hypothetical protein
VDRNRETPRASKFFRVDDRFYASQFSVAWLDRDRTAPAALCSCRHHPQVQPDAKRNLTQTISCCRDAARCKLNHGTRVAVGLCLQCNIWQHHTHGHCWVCMVASRLWRCVWVALAHLLVHIMCAVMFSKKHQCPTSLAVNIISSGSCTEAYMRCTHACILVQNVRPVLSEGHNTTSVHNARGTEAGCCDACNAVSATLHTGIECPFDHQYNLCLSRCTTTGSQQAGRPMHATLDVLHNCMLVGAHMPIDVHALAACTNDCLTA